MLYCFVDQQKAEGFPVERVCEIAGVSMSAYYDWKKHRDGRPTASRLRERLLVAEIRQIHKDSGGTYGSPRVTAELHDQGRVVNHKRVERLMRIHDIVGYTPPSKTVTTIPNTAHRTPDLVKRDFFGDWLDQLWAGDISYIRTQEGFLYLAVVEDLASRRIVGLSMANHMRTELVSNALREAVGTRSGDGDGAVFHSDRGSRYTSGDYGTLCAGFGITQSVGRTGQCWDNAPVESFFATLKKELVYRTIFRTRAEARIAIRHWTESWYNLRRRSSVIGYQSPIERENNYHRNTETLTAQQPCPADRGNSTATIGVSANSAFTKAT